MDSYKDCSFWSLKCELMGLNHFPLHPLDAENFCRTTAKVASSCRNFIRPSSLRDPIVSETKLVTFQGLNPNDLDHKPKMLSKTLCVRATIWEASIGIWGKTGVIRRLLLFIQSIS